MNRTRAHKLCNKTNLQLHRKHNREVGSGQDKTCCCSHVITSRLQPWFSTCITQHENFEIWRLQLQTGLHLCKGEREHRGSWTAWCGHSILMRKRHLFRNKLGTLSACLVELDTNPIMVLERNKIGVIWSTKNKWKIIRKKMQESSHKFADPYSERRVNWVSNSARHAVYVHPWALRIGMCSWLEKNWISWCLPIQRKTRSSPTHHGGGHPLSKNTYYSSLDVCACILLLNNGHILCSLSSVLAISYSSCNRRPHI
jgi:hypothetical protein